MHVMEAVINFSKLPVMSDIFVDFDFALEVIWTRSVYEWFDSCKGPNIYLRRDPEFQSCP
jgi:hypothetical protein